MNLIISFTVFATTILISIALHLLYHLFLMPLYRMRTYRRQGVNCAFSPIYGLIKLVQEPYKETGDSQGYFKKKARESPERLICANLYDKLVLILHDTTLIKHFYSNQNYYIKDPWRSSLFKLVVGRGIPPTSGDLWKAQRKFFGPFFQFDYIASTLPSLQNIARQAFEFIKRGNIESCKVMTEQLMRQIIGQVMAQIFFGESIHHYKINGEPINSFLSRIFDDMMRITNSKSCLLIGTWFVKLGLLRSHKRFMNKIKVIRSTFRTIVEKRRRQPAAATAAHTNMLDCMLDSSLVASYQNLEMSTEDIIDHCLSFYMSGLDGTSNFLSMLIYFLWKYPSCKKKILEEIDEFYCAGDKVTIENLNKMQFLTAFIKEGLRITPPVSAILPRLAVVDHKLGDLFIKKGDLVQVELLYNGFNPQVFTNPDEFDPNRWLAPDFKLEPYAYVPFSAGPHNCIAQQFVYIQVKVIISEMLKMYDVQLPEGYKLRMRHEALYRPERPFVATFTLRNQQTKGNTNQSEGFIGGVA